MVKKPQTIGHCVFAYRQQMHARASQSMIADALWASDHGFNYVTWYQDIGAIDRSRNTAVVRALRHGIDYLVMQDSDVFALHGECLLRDCIDAMEDADATACGAVFVLRTRESVNADPARPGEVYRGRVGTGYMVINLRKMADAPLPWFRFTLNADGTDNVIGEDFGFCEMVEARGGLVVVNYKTATGHASESFLRCVPTEIVRGVSDLVAF